MRRLLMMVPIVALAVTGFVPAQAADPPEKTPIVVACVGTAGYEGDVWKTSSRVEDVPGHLDTCAAWSPDTAELPSGPLPSVEPIPNDPFDYYWRVERWYGQAVPAAPAKMAIWGSGDFACGDGTLAAVENKGKDIEYGNQGVVFGNYWSWDLDWTATFENGVGELDGTATRVRFAHGEIEETRSLSGRILVNDGAAYDQCDDSAGASQVVAVFVLE